jgi:hypothetical protein
MKNENTRRRTIVSIATVLLAVSIGSTFLSVTSFQHVTAQKGNSSMMSSAGQNQSKMMMSTYGPNITGSVQLGPTIAKAIASQVHVSLANASEIAEKAVGSHTNSVAVRIGVVHGFLVYMALVVDSSNNFHGVLVDAGNGKVLASNAVPLQYLSALAAITTSGTGMMTGPGMMMGPGMGMMGPQLMFQPGMAVPVQPGMMGPGMGMIGH